MNKKKILSLAAFGAFTISTIGCGTVEYTHRPEPKPLTEMEQKRQDYDTLMSGYSTFAEKDRSFESLNSVTEETLEFLGDTSAHDAHSLLSTLNTYSDVEESPESLKNALKRTLECAGGRSRYKAAGFMSDINRYSEDISAEELVNRFCENVDKYYD